MVRQWFVLVKANEEDLTQRLQRSEHREHREIQEAKGREKMGSDDEDD
jgi:hypothetical protein